MLRVIRDHKRAAGGEAARRYEGLWCDRHRRPCDRRRGPGWAELSEPRGSSGIVTRSTLARSPGSRNAQVSAIAPTSTIGLVMDCDTTGIEPDFALVKFKKLAAVDGSRSSTALGCPAALARARL